MTTISTSLSTFDGTYRLPAATMTTTSDPVAVVQLGLPTSSVKVSISTQALQLAQVVDNVAPTVKTFTPADGSSTALPTANVVVKFSEAIQRGTGLIVLKNAATGAVVETFDAASSNRLSINNDTLTINPTKDLAFNTRYKVTFASGTVKDLTGNGYAGTTAYDFRTSSSGTSDTTAPRVTAFSPVDGATGVSTTTNISITFSESVQRGTGNIQLLDALDNVIESFNVASSDRISISGNTLTIDPTSALDYGTAYKVQFGTGTVMDIAGNDYVATNSVYDFTTEADPNLPVSNFNIDIVYNGDQAYQTYFQQAATIWQSIILGDLPDINGVDDLRISANVNVIDGLGGVLGQAGPTDLRAVSYLPWQGDMTFDSADMTNMAANGSLLGVILHEMGHVLGLGTLWNTFGLNSNFGEYTGSEGLAAYRQLSGNNSATFVPLETTSGSAGTDNVHWSEGVFDTELMTGFAENSGNMPLSVLTIAALDDLGYQVSYTEADTYVLPSPLQSGSLSLMA